MKKISGGKPKIALALAGGGPLGAIYEIGALCALEESWWVWTFHPPRPLCGRVCRRLYCGGLANGMSPRELCASFIENGQHDAEMFDPAWLMVPAYGEFARRGIMLPDCLAALWRLLRSRSLTGAAERLGPGLPTGVFSNDEHRPPAHACSLAKGVPTTFATAHAPDAGRHQPGQGEAAPFGRPGWDHVPISQAVQASSALPGLFPPVEIGEHYYVDGALKKTMHATVALDEGVDLMLCLNPLVPFDATSPAESLS
jgi:NTE family protein